MKRRYVLIGIAGIAVIALISTAIAGSGDSPGDKAPGAEAAAKKKGKRGPPGPPGPAGPPGAQGPPGTPGTNGTNGTNGANGATNVTTRTVGLNVNAGATGGATASCNAGEKATGGGYGQATTIAPSNLFVDANRPQPLGTPTQWFVNLQNTSGSNYVGLVYVVCAAP